MAKKIATETRHQITVSELIIRCQTAITGMSAHNPNRLLLLNCAFALRQLTERLYEYEGEGAVQ